MQTQLKPISKVNGELILSGDKSISHRSVMFASLAYGKSTIKNCLNSEDVISTINIFRSLGVEIEKNDEIITVYGSGLFGLSEPKVKLDAGNSGTTSRLMMGILAAQNFNSTIIGDESLSQRPMKRVIEPLSLLGAKFNSNNGYLPVEVIASEGLSAINYELQVASAQVKSSLLLAAMHINETSCIVEEELTRDHTERMLGLRTEIKNGKKYIYASKDNYPQPNEYIVPSDISTAAFFIVLALCFKNSDLVIKNVSLNPTRNGIINILQRMGGNIEILDEKNSGNEPYGDIRIKYSELKNIQIEKDIVPNIIDEIPILSVAGLLADGVFEIRNAKELRVKESDRIKAMVNNYISLGVDVEELEDGFILSGEIKNKNVVIDSYGDHRIAMAFGILSLIKNLDLPIKDFDCVKISNPNFIGQIEQVNK